jgi:hypothetical protein
MFRTSTLRICIALLFSFVSATTFGQGCVIDTNNFEMIYPPSDDLPCVERNVPYSATIQFLSLPSIGGYTVDSLLVTTFLNLPTGITYTLNPSPLKLYPYDRGCVLISGITSDTVGNYLVDYNGFAYTQAGSPSFDWLRNNFGGVLPEYSLKVIEPGTNCRGSSTGINAVQQAPGFSIYPNPSNGIFEVKISSLLKHDGELVISDATGRIVYSQKTTPALGTTINLGSYPKGLYLVQLRSEEGITTKHLSVE